MNESEIAIQFDALLILTFFNDEYFLCIILQLYNKISYSRLDELFICVYDLFKYKLEKNMQQIKQYK